MFRSLRQSAVFAAQFYLTCLIILGWALQNGAFAQVSPGKNEFGGRTAALANSAIADFKGDFGTFSNPGQTGFLRDWQMAAAFSDWGGGVNQAALFFGKRLSFKNPISDFVVLAAIADYQKFSPQIGEGFFGAPNITWTTPGFSVGLPVSVVSNNLSIGANARFLRVSSLGESAQKTLFDVGLLYRSPVLKLSEDGIFEDFFFSAGAALTHLGGPLLFQNAAVSLEAASAFGAGLHFRKHNGLQFSLFGGYHAFSSDSSEANLGVEIRGLLSPLSKTLGKMLAFQGGYRTRQANSGRYAAGLSLHFDGASFGPFAKALANDKSLRIDVNAIGGSAFSSPRGHASVHLQSERLEKFEWRQTEKSFVAAKDTVKLEWERAPDLAQNGKVNYMLLLAREDSLSLVNVFERLENDNAAINELLRASRPIQTVSRENSVATPSGPFDQQLEIYNIENDVLLHSDVNILGDRRLKASKDKLAYHFQETLRHGDYFWSVLAYDAKRNFRIASREGVRVAGFIVKPDVIKPDLKVSVESFALSQLLQTPDVDVKPVYFPANSANISEELAAQLESWAILIRNYPSGVFEISAHADVVHSRDIEKKISFNAEFALQRAQKIKAFLISRGVRGSQLVEKGYSEEILRDASLASLNYCRVELDFLEDSRRRSSTDFANIIFKNIGEKTAESFLVSIYHSPQSQNELGVLLMAANPRNDGGGSFYVDRFMKKGELISEFTMHRLAPGETDSLRIPIDPQFPNIVAYVDRDNRIFETDEQNNWHMDELAQPTKAAPVAAQSVSVDEPIDFAPAPKESSDALQEEHLIDDGSETSTMNEADKTSVHISDIRFSFQEFRLDDEGESALLEIANSLKENASAKIEIAGFASLENVPEERRALQYCANLKISQKRAKYVRDFLVAQGVDPGNLVARGYGHNFPLAENDSEENRAKNRRVEIRPFQESSIDVQDCDH